MGCSYLSQSWSQQLSPGGLPGETQHDMLRNHLGARLEASWSFLEGVEYCHEQLIELCRVCSLGASNSESLPERINISASHWNGCGEAELLTGRTPRHTSSSRQIMVQFTSNGGHDFRQITHVAS